jgi:Ca2+-binding EF-hand superfamily protein
MEASDMASMADSANQLFQSWDKNGEGAITRGELKRCMKVSACFAEMIKRDDFHWKDLWLQYDQNADGTVTTAEFVRLYSECLCLAQREPPSTAGASTPPRSLR